MRKKTDGKLVLDEVDSAAFAIYALDGADHPLDVGGPADELDFVVGRDMPKSQSILHLDEFRVRTA